MQASYVCAGYTVTLGDWRDVYAKVGAGSRGWKCFVGWVGY